MLSATLRNRGHNSCHIKLRHHQCHLLLLLLLLVLSGGILLGRFQLCNGVLKFLELISSIRILLFENVNSDNALFVVELEFLDLKAELV